VTDAKKYFFQTIFLSPTKIRCTKSFETKNMTVIKNMNVDKGDEYQAIYEEEDLSYLNLGLAN